MKAVVIGAGYGAVHADALRAAGADVVGFVVAREVPGRAEQLGVDWVTSDLTKALATDPDLVVVCNPPVEHRGAAVAALATAATVVIDKPLAESRSSAEEIVRAAATRTAPTHLSFQWRSFPPLRQLRDRCRAGTATMLHLRFTHDFFRVEPGLDTSWRADRTKAGAGALGDMGVHLFDLARYLLGRDLRVRTAAGGRARPLQPGEEASWTEDHATVWLDDPDGVVVVVQVDRCSHQGRELTVTVDGLDGAASVSVAVESGAWNATGTTETAGVDDPMLELYRHVLDGSTGDELATIHDGAQAQQLLDDCCNAIYNHERIRSATT